MSENRFILNGLGIIDTRTEQSLSRLELVNMLNHLWNDNNEVSIKDKVKNNYPFALAYEHNDDADNLIQECLSLVDLLNEQQATINELKERNAHNFAKKMQLMKENEQLRKELQEMKSDEKLYAQEILELNKTKKEMLNYRNLGSDY